MVSGFFAIFVSLLALFQTGVQGTQLWEMLKVEFSQLGALIISTTLLIIGILLFFDTSVDKFLILTFDTLKKTVSYLKIIFAFIIDFLKNIKEKRPKKKEFKLKEEKKEFIKEKLPFKKPSTTEARIKKEPGTLQIKPVLRSNSSWVYPPLTLLEDVVQQEADRGDVSENADIIERNLESFGIRGAKVVDVNYGPTVTQYALRIKMGTKLSKITALANDLALALAAPTGQVRIEAPIPGKSLVGIEIPNRRPQIITLKSMLTSPLFQQNSDPLLVPLGVDVGGAPQAASISEMPHILIAGTTGSGKSVLLNSWISTFLFRTTPTEIRLILVDPKRVELTLYNGTPHLLSKVVVDPAEIISALRWTVSEMESRYKEFAKAGVRNIAGYNKLEGVEKKPYIIFVIDELADLMIFAAREAEELITRIAQMARATGIHLVLATQRPSVDVITGLMKANIPARIAFNVSSLIDSRVIIDTPGAEKLLGKGDMLYLPPDQAKPKRIQGPFITDHEVKELVAFLKTQSPEVHYTEEVVKQDMYISGPNTTNLREGGEKKDPRFNEALSIIMQLDKASASLLQRRMSIGYTRAARILDQLEQAGYIGPAEGSKPRKVIKKIAEETT